MYIYIHLGKTLICIKLVLKNVFKDHFVTRKRGAYVKTITLKCYNWLPGQNRVRSKLL